MEGQCEKIYCYDNGGCNSLMPFMAGSFANRGNDWQNNPFIYLVWMMFAQRMWGNDWGGGFGHGGCGGAMPVQTAEIQAQINSLRTQMSDNQNATLLMDGLKGNNSAIQQLAQNLRCDFNTLNSCCCDLKQAVAQVGGQVGFSAERVINAVNAGDCQVIQALKDCCCQTQQSIMKMGYENQLATCHQTNELRMGQRDLGVAITEGFSKVGYQQAADKCDIIRAGQDNTQRIIDTLNSHWKDEQTAQIQDLKFQLSQERQTRMIERMGRSNWGNNGCGCMDGCNF